MRENRVERIKQEKDGLDVWADVERYGRDGSLVDPDDLERFKWYGIYTQRPPEAGYYMLRIKIPNGILDSSQLETIGWLSEVYARSTGDITTRQDIQLHYVRLADLPHIVSELESVGLTTREACGDVVRNVVGCPLAGVDDDELLDASPLVRRVSSFFASHRDFSNLPRKFKISISGCARGCAQHEINDIGLVAARNDEGEVGFDLWVGGGLGSRAHLARRLGAFIWYDEAPEVITRIVELFRDHGPREDRKRARLKFLVAAWGEERFRRALEDRLGRELDDYLGAPDLNFPGRRDHLGIGAQRQPGLHYVGAAVARGRISGIQMISVAGLARRYASGRIRLTNTQNLIILDVPQSRLDALVADLDNLDLRADATPFRRGTVSCTGRQFCKLAVVETKDRAAEIIRHLEAALPDFREDFRISVTGCVNSCAQYQVCEVGLVGVKGVVHGEEADFFQIHLGGHLGPGAAFGRQLSKRVPVEEAKFYVERLARAFLARRAPGERFHEFLARLSSPELEVLDETASAALVS
jgi:sulfite reductase beta subunit-like hemoprotein